MAAYLHKMNGQFEARGREIDFAADIYTHIYGRTFPGFEAIRH